MIISGSQVRLWGIRPPPADQSCRDDTGDLFPCGRIAATALGALTAGRLLECDVRSFNQDVGIVARCSADQVDLAGFQVLAGYAIDVPAVSGGSYRTEQLAAIERRAGIWRSLFPWPSFAPQPRHEGRHQ
ncbi:MAG TPA: thermonuclease family protein [Kaistia sp.]|nr:thermonuclease family protein [Kaistia sp.]